jgi:hypothetical protein
VTPAKWSWIAAAASMVGLWVSGHSPRAGWAYGIVCQVVWVAYGWSTGQPGMIALSAAFVMIYVRNLYRNRGARFVRPHGPADTQLVDGSRLLPATEHEWGQIAP